MQERQRASNQLIVYGRKQYQLTSHHPITNHHDSLEFLGIVNNFHVTDLLSLLYQGGSDWLLFGGLPATGHSLCRH